MEEHLTLGQRIQKGRKATGLSQEALGEQLGVSRQAINNRLKKIHTRLAKLMAEMDEG